MNENLVRTNLVLTKKLRKEFQNEANKKYGGNMSLLLKILLAERYKMPGELAPEFR
jgi:hypothetical protein